MELTNQQYLEILGQKELQIQVLQSQIQQLQQDKEALHKENEELRQQVKSSEE